MIGVIFFEWSLFAIIFLYWSENISIGILNAMRMLRTKGTGKYSKIMFFAFHYGTFTAIHGVFIFSMFGPSDVSLISLVGASIMMFVSHYISYRVNFIGKGEYKTVSASKLLTQPYKRIIILHVSIIAGGFLVDVFGAPLLGLIIFIILKTGVDLGIHKWEHANLQSK